MGLCVCVVSSVICHLSFASFKVLCLLYLAVVGRCLRGATVFFSFLTIYICYSYCTCGLMSYHLCYSYCTKTKEALRLDVDDR
jgi:hypothetical protein